MQFDPDFPSWRAESRKQELSMNSACCIFEDLQYHEVDGGLAKAPPTLGQSRTTSGRKAKKASKASQPRGRKVDWYSPPMDPMGQNRRWSQLKKAERNRLSQQHWHKQHSASKKRKLSEATADMGPLSSFIATMGQGSTEGTPNLPHVRATPPSGRSATQTQPNDTTAVAPEPQAGQADEDVDPEHHAEAHCCPPAQRQWMDQLRRDFDRRGTFIYHPPDAEEVVRTPGFDHNLLYRTTAILWDPPVSWRHLFGNRDYMPCPHCGWAGDIKRDGWHNHGPRRVYHVDRSWWLWGRTYLCRTCRKAGRTCYYKSYNEKSMKALLADASADFKCVLESFPAILTRKAAISNSTAGSLKADIDATFRSKEGWAGLCRRLKAFTLERYAHIEEIYGLAALAHKSSNQRGILQQYVEPPMLLPATHHKGMFCKWPSADYLLTVGLALHAKRRNWMIRQLMDIRGNILKADMTFAVAKKIRYAS
eukprot:scaffold343548_cov17-Prasinocladus_malaysianus.AAC.1